MNGDAFTDENNVSMALYDDSTNADADAMLASSAAAFVPAAGDFPSLAQPGARYVVTGAEDEAERGVTSEPASVSAATPARSFAAKSALMSPSTPAVAVSGGESSSPFATPTSAAAALFVEAPADAAEARAALALSSAALSQIIHGAAPTSASASSTEINAGIVCDAAVSSLLEAATASDASAAAAAVAAAQAAVAAAAAEEAEAAAVAAGPSNGRTLMYKVLVVGNAKCGKTSLIQRYVRGRFQDEYRTTIGADYSRKVVPQQDGSHVHLQLWDLAGQDRFAKLTRPYYRHARAAIVVCDISRAETLTAVRDWKAELDAQFELDTEAGRARFPVVLLMNKSDLLDKSVDELLRMGQQLERLKNELKFTAAFTTSAKACRYVTETMDFVVASLFAQEGPVDAAGTNAAAGADAEEDEVEAMLAVASASASASASAGVVRRKGGKKTAEAANTASAAAAAGAETGAIDLSAPTLAPGQQASCCY